MSSMRVLPSELDLACSMNHPRIRSLASAGSSLIRDSSGSTCATLALSVSLAQSGWTRAVSMLRLMMPAYWGSMETGPVRKECQPVRMTHDVTIPVSARLTLCELIVQRARIA